MELTERSQSVETSSQLTAYGVMPCLRVVKEPPHTEEEPRALRCFAVSAAWPGVCGTERPRNAGCAG